MARAGNVSKQEKEKFRSTLIASLQQSAEAEKLSLAKEELDHVMQDFVTETVTKIENFQKVLSGKKKVRFTAREIRLALILYNSSPAGYYEIRNFSIQILPSERCLKEYRKKMKVKAGENPETYGILRDRLGLKHG